jgi:hypothetical protein
MNKYSRNLGGVSCTEKKLQQILQLCEITLMKCIQQKIEIYLPTVHSFKLIPLLC